MMPRKFEDSALDQADEMRAKGMRWIVIEACLGEGVKQACYYRQTKGYLGTYSESAEIQQALAAWDGVGDKQSFIDGWTCRAKKQRIFT